MAIETTTVVLDPSWRLEAHESAVFVLGGADSTFVLPVDSSEIAQRICSALEGPVRVGDPAGPEDELFDELLTAGVLRRVARTPLAASDARTVNVEAFGPYDSTVAEELRRAIAGVLNGAVAAWPAGDEMTVVVRTGGSLLELCEKLSAQSRARPHLFVDLAQHHTVSIGPLVVPGDTACLACFAGRVAISWGDATAPVHPGIVRRHLVAATALAASEVRSIADGDLTLAGASFWFDFEERSSGTERVFKLPWCPYCGDASGAPSRHRGQSARVWASLDEELS